MDLHLTFIARESQERTAVGNTKEIVQRPFLRILPNLLHKEGTEHIPSKQVWYGANEARGTGSQDTGLITEQPSPTTDAAPPKRVGGQRRAKSLSLSQPPPLPQHGWASKGPGGMEDSDAISPWEQASSICSIRTVTTSCCLLAGRRCRQRTLCAA